MITEEGARNLLGNPTAELTPLERGLLEDIPELKLLLAELLDAYIGESAALNDPREPQRYREAAQELVIKMRRVLEPDESA